MNMSEPTQFSTEGLRGEMFHNEPMSRHTSWRAGGRAKRMYRPADLADLQRFLQLTPADEPLIAVGLGSNLLVRDGGLNGTVLLMVGALTELRMDGEHTIYAQAGVAGAKLARFAASNHLCGAEFFVGIPGTLGGMLAMNAGCYGGETWQKVQRVQVLMRSGELLERTPKQYEIGYRHVALRNAGKEFFVGAWLQLESGDVEAARQEIKALMEKRSASQPLQLPNAGSVFRNPPGGHAAKLIEGCGLKGRRIGGAQVSEKHANFIVNVGGATAADIENLIEEVRETVLRRTGIELHPEVKIVGERI
ncbi:UDP-N-acetylenolpyruvoylglucosamine reductase [Sideroxyarcus emersonii]|uniref:UDP-N-acetylenolpyruvoylglucosamine reductase n=1 Tax=Sideroxyarcus emersonii TaxID=2764705 RepID=A0AAN1XC36_9PROT|nr:UDP-N-acetylmuramate dehydrogenase [Sideroxyarcus emersonii]BCK88680.1 UDP-N-acetylenolpyruvoylglucosamine reductase [Sideroxyarcus emersonii]